MNSNNSSNSSPSISNETFRISILQAPTKARMCGLNASLGKRLLDPAPVVQLHLGENFEEKADEFAHFSDLTHFQDQQENKFICLATLCSPQRGPSFGSITRADEKTTRAAALLIGSKCQNMRLLSVILKEKPTLTFVFPDLAIRVNGRFRLKFVCAHLPS